MQRYNNCLTLASNLGEIYRKRKQISPVCGYFLFSLWIENFLTNPVLTQFPVNSQLTPIS